MVSLRDAMDRLFQESFVRPTSRLLISRESALPLDVYETDNELVVKAALPGIKPEDVDITLTGDCLTIKGEAKAEDNVKEEDYFLHERRYGAFSRAVTLPVPVVGDKAEAKFENGVLTISLPKAEEVKPKPIKVKSK
jgi:HSP20 family protein